VEGAVQRQTAVTAPPEATDRPLLKGGEVSDQVAQLRMQLNIAGADPQLPASRLYDEAAIEAVKKFQSKHGLQPDGQPGPKTWGMLDAIARDRVPDQDAMNDLREKATAADKLYDAGDYDAARTLYRSLYRTGNLPAEVRDQFTWNWAASEHHLGNFDLALSLYQEFITNPGRSTKDQRDALQRIQECRSHLPPRPTESSVTEDRERALAGG
jgi:peptidoglycan hydrolase-like protein with peptidoglycan-binding domain